MRGVWRIAERVTPAGNARAQGVEVKAGEPVAEPQDLQNLTDAAKLARYEQWLPFTANSRSYELKGSILLRHPIVAKNVAVMIRDPQISLEVRWEDPDTFWLIPTGERARTEPRTKLTRLE